MGFPKLIIAIIFSILLSISSVLGVQTIEFKSDYGVNNFLILAYMIIMFFFWLWIFNKTKPIKYDFNSFVKSLSNVVVRVLSLGWLFVIFYLSKSVLMISSGETFVQDVLFFFNIMYIITFIFGAFYLLVLLIKYWSKSSGLVDFLQKVLWEIKNE